ncbi:hypothetical protein RJ639_031771 [Escallonia herrerae]|uniref:DUF4283 domain-containing protein n=1 Tax=Escallonia herrerae TaxID=1293975 RepID=A0AA88X1R9_9ASTE|nr:hypothetical protein RJ639_031771 [Escallonia herrerae]
MVVLAAAKVIGSGCNCGSGSGAEQPGVLQVIPSRTVQLHSGPGQLHIFTSEAERSWAIHQGPWHFENNFLVFQQFHGAKQSFTIKFLEADFWVHVLNLPLGGVNSSVGERIGNKIDKFVSMGVTPSQQIWVKTLKIGVRIDITKPLQRGMRIPMGKNQSA